ncbi:hypothetical protein CJ195_08995 [Bacillus sp. UMB0899]|nr:hypothetical protein CJ195_08995 [Bacillus sp. UMB0899]
MLNRVSVLIPYKPDFGERDILFKWVNKFYQNVLPEVEVCIGESLSEPFNRSQAVNLAAKKATRDIFVIADGDVFYDPIILIKAIKLLDQHAWVIPYGKWLNVSKESTDLLLSKEPQWPFPIKIESKEKTFKNKQFKPISGVVVTTKKNFNNINGFDERFVGWGREDNAFRDAMNTLCGPYKRLDNQTIYHLWHTKVGSKGNPKIQDNNKLYNRYAALRGNKKGMGKLINERNN